MLKEAKRQLKKQQREDKDDESQKFYHSKIKGKINIMNIDINKYK